MLGGGGREEGMCITCAWGRGRGGGHVYHMYLGEGEGNGEMMCITCAATTFNNTFSADSDTS